MTTNDKLLQQFMQAGIANSILKTYYLTASLSLMSFISYSFNKVFLIDQVPKANSLTSKC